MSLHRVTKMSVKFSRFTVAKARGWCFLAHHHHRFGQRLNIPPQQLTSPWHHFPFENIFFPRYRKKLQLAVHNFGKAKTHCFPFLEYIFAWDIVDEFGPDESRVVNMASTNTGVPPYFM